MKKCCRCKQEKDEKCFSKKWNRMQSACRDCHKLYASEHYKLNKDYYLTRNIKNRQKNKMIFYEFLDSKSCVDCWNSDRRVLEFDHISWKSFNIGNKIQDSKLSSLMKEINKCEIVCCNCHRIRTLIRAWSKK